MFGKSISSREFSRGVFESSGDFSPVSLGATSAHLPGHRINTVGRNVLVMPPESPYEVVGFVNVGNEHELDLVEWITLGQKYPINQGTRNLEAVSKRMHSLVSIILNGHRDRKIQNIRRHRPLEKEDGGIG